MNNFLNKAANSILCIINFCLMIYNTYLVVLLGKCIYGNNIVAKCFCAFFAYICLSLINDKVYDMLSKGEYSEVYNEFKQLDINEMIDDENQTLKRFKQIISKNRDFVITLNLIIMCILTYLNSVVFT
jgi:uncharacterized membrane protein (DUF485 family)